MDKKMEVSSAMKLVRWGEPGRERPGVVAADGVRLDVSACVPDFDPAFFHGDGLRRLGAWLAEHTTTAPRVDARVRWGPPVGAPSKIVCVGLNYRDHAAETGMAIPAEPVLFLKAPSALAGPNDPVVIPRGGGKLDWEVELAVVIGTQARYVSEDDALEYVAGYCIVNDVSERSFQMATSQWDKGKGFDTAGPIGPWLVTPDEVRDPQALDLWLDVNGKRMQSGSTRTMIFGVAKCISHVSQYMTLMPGDIIATGTPPGVGLGIKPTPVFLRPGDVMTLGIRGLGEQRQKVVPFTA